MRDKLQSVQALRGIAACAVVLLHSTMREGATFELGAAGVDLFFVISGFIIATISPGQLAGQFLLRRCWRIYPLWWVAVAAFLPWAIGYGRTTSLSDLLWNLSLIPVNLGLIYPAVGWTLCFEMLFYLAFALAMKARPAVPLSVFAVAFTVGLWTGRPLFIGNPMILEFLMGVVIAKMPRAGYPFLLAVVGLSALAVSPGWLFQRDTVFSGDALWRVIFWGFPCALIVYGGLGLERLLSARPLVLLGDASYSIYLFHMLGIMAVESVPLRFVAGVATGLFFYFAVERRLAYPRRTTEKQLATSMSADVSVSTVANTTQ